MSDFQNGDVKTFTPNDVNSADVDPIVTAFEAGQLLVYPTEAVMGIGCDPDNEAAVNQLLEVKQRAVEKGVILIAALFVQIDALIFFLVGPVLTRGCCLSRPLHHVG